LSWLDWSSESGIPAAVLVSLKQRMPDERSARQWARNRGDFGAKYAAARRLGYEKRAVEMLENADDSSADWVESEGGGKVLNSVHVNRARLMIDTRKWLLSKMLPKSMAIISRLRVIRISRSSISCIRLTGPRCQTRRSKQSRCLRGRLTDESRSNKACDRSSERTIRQHTDPHQQQARRSLSPEPQARQRGAEGTLRACISSCRLLARSPPQGPQNCRG
jgi:hypothetical protein